jgi:hypothetical protein
MGTGGWWNVPEGSQTVSLTLNDLEKVYEACTQGDYDTSPFYMMNSQYLLDWPSVSFYSSSKQPEVTLNLKEEW